MLLRGRRRPIPLLAAAVLFISVISIYEVYSLHGLHFSRKSFTKNAFWPWSKYQNGTFSSSDQGHTDTAPGSLIPELANISTTHTILLSASRPDRRYFPIIFDSVAASNPNIIPHPRQADTWIIVAQQHHDPQKDEFRYAEIACTAQFTDGALRCIDPPSALPIASTSGPHCTGDLEYVSNNDGPHDARVFYGPAAPYTVYGSNSAYTCFGQWMQDLRFLVDWGTAPVVDWGFRTARDLQRPAPYHPMEKNWFPFWDSHGQIYIHHDLSPQRVFSKLPMDGDSAVQDLGSFARPSDDFCMAKYMPTTKRSSESIHQATNSLLVTLCARADRACRVDKTNTYIMTLFQHKTFDAYHSVYEPYLMLFRQDPPFDIRAISKKPFWINGRGRPGEKRPSYLPLSLADPWNQTEMFYATSISWKSREQTYHGYKDDVLFIAFGIEDEQSAGIDIVAEDLMQDLGFCDDRRAC
ncbi:hypothetical protein A1O1_09200 [Capronia coronata CBS 617.96]|uniref:Uncharacterized protein n=1 Tax=Capronia coronata CBS 617.96 TaxID=1182541 RepID=W9XEZ5_9EURO|nr:uncharacterized protein A1O1_09200 [Capronia coronata CBS 617.96]EXJ78798.1 hypothetical protein A1O1_09200 [Capronia coronata CBS 617.96]